MQRTAALLTIAAAAVGVGLFTLRPSGATAQRPVAAADRPYVLHLTMQTGAMIHRPGWPRFLANGHSSARIVLPANRLVEVVLTSADTGSAAPPAVYDRVQGLAGGKELVNGKPIAAVTASAVAHTFTIAGLGVNVVVPVAPAHGPAVVVARFRTGKAGVYSWQCMAPCGTGPSGWGGPMVTPGFMMGQVVVQG